MFLSPGIFAFSSIRTFDASPGERESGRRAARARADDYDVELRLHGWLPLPASLSGRGRSRRRPRLSDSGRSGRWGRWGQVHRDYLLRLRHPDSVLEGAAYAEGDVQLGAHGRAGLADLVVLADEALKRLELRVDERPGRAYLRPEPLLRLDDALQSLGELVRFAGVSGPPLLVLEDPEAEADYDLGVAEDRPPTEGVA